MAGNRPGPARRPNLQVIREGNPDRRTKAELERGIKVRPEAPAEPDWRDWFPVAQRGESKKLNEMARARARSVWRRVVPVLDAQGILSTLDLELLTDLPVTVARLLQAERDVSLNGLYSDGERGKVRNPAVLAAKQYREQLRFLCGQLGLSPVARDFLQPPAPEGEIYVAESAFDI